MTHALQHSPVLQALLAALPADRIRLGDAIGARHHTDWTRMDPQCPLALLLPRNTEEVSTMLRICHAHRQPVVAQGGLTGLVGGAHPQAHEVALSLERMNAIGEVDVSGGTLTVQAGAILESVQQAAEAAGFCCGLDIGARGSCTLGGNIATNAGGNRVIRYGMARDNLLGLEVVLADGTVVSSLNKMIKNNSGYDLKHLFIGSEGTLGIVTQAVLRLHPLPSTTQCALLALPDLDAALKVLREARARLGGSLSAFEVMWPNFYEFVTRLPGVDSPLQGQHGMYLLLEAQGGDEAQDGARFEQLLSHCLEQGWLADAAIAQSMQDQQRFWHLRDAVAEFPVHLPHRSTFDVSFPLDGMAQAVQQVEASAEAAWPGCTRMYFGHLGDNNLHIVIDVPGTQGSHAPAIEQLVYDCVGALQGAVSAEHGIGRKKRQHLAVTRSPEEIALMHTLKQALDPLGILNPGKVL
ncbi:MAG: FAD-binding oxidoreductase [Acidovorax sp.]|nr:FAD-binding oxidoreductase [Acidovorax sp.]